MKKTTVGGFAMSGKKGMKHYSQAIKEEAVRLHLEEGFTLKEVMQQLNIMAVSRIKAWCTAYRREGMSGLHCVKPKGRPRKSARTEHEQLLYELKQLRTENELLRSFLYDAGRR